MNGSLDPGLLIIHGQLAPGISHAEGEDAIFDIIHGLDTIEESELEKVKNQAEATVEFGEVEVLQRAMNLAFCTAQGDTEEVNRETDRIRAVTRDDISRVREKFLVKENCSALHYHAKPVLHEN